MRYKSTRDSAAKEYVTSAEAIKRGLAPDGGLYLPDGTPALTSSDLEKLCAMTYSERAAYVLSLFLDDYDADGLKADCDAAYSEEKFPGGAAPTADIGGLMREVQHEPKMALDGDADGLRFYRAITNNWLPYLKQGGLLAVEIGIGQAADVKALFETAGLHHIAVYRDLGGVERVVTGRK